MLEFKSYASSSSGNVHSISDGETTIMLDCGIPWKKIQKAFFYETSKVAGVCLTHAHKDHSLAIPDAAKAGLDIYLLPETLEALGLEGHRYHPITPLKQFKIGTFAIWSFPLEHDVPNSGFLFSSNGEKAIYITDTAYCRFRFPALSVIAIECNYIPRILRKNVSAGTVALPQKNRLLHSHFSLDNVLEFLNANDLSALQEVWLLHLSDGNSNEAEMKEAVQKATGKPVYVAQER